MKQEVSTKRKRTVRSEPEHSFTGMKREILQVIAQSHYLNTDQVAGIIGKSLKATREHLRDLYDLKMLDAVEVPQAVLGTGSYGNGPKVHVPTKEGLKALLDLDMLPEQKQRQPGGHVTIAHQLATRDVLVWLAKSGRAYAGQGQAVERWECGGETVIGNAHPDALFVYKIAPGEDGAVLMGIVETDMGTERGISGPGDKWGTKIASYGTVFAEESRETLYKSTGFQRARLVVTVNLNSRAAWIARRVKGTPIERAVWIASRWDLLENDVYAPIWLRPDGTRGSFLEGG